MSKIISLHSFRGGTGKSNTTANIAALLAADGRRVGVVDTDIQSPGIHILFGLAGEQVSHALNDYLWGKCKIEETAYDVSPILRIDPGTVVVMGGGIYLIPSSIKAGEITRILRDGYDVGMLNDGFRDLVTRLHLDYLMIDTHPGLNEETLLSIAISDTMVIIMRPDQQDYQGTAVTVDVAQRLEVPRMLMVVNKVLPESDFAAIRDEVEKTYGIPVAGILPFSRDMIRLGSRGIFCLRFPDQPFSQCIREIMARVIG